MEEFEYFLQLGNSLESQNRMLAAYGIYAAAAQRGNENNKGIIESFLPVLARKISISPEERNQELKETLLSWIREKKMAEAFICEQSVLEHLNGLNWVDQDNAVLYHCLYIWAEENHRETAAWNLANGNLQAITHWYYRLKFMVRRRLTGLCTKEEFTVFLSSNEISEAAAEYMAGAVYIPPAYPIIEHVFDADIEYTEKIAFIIPVDDEELFAEAEFYIRHLQVPQGMSVEVLPIRGASSMTAAYNDGMRRTNARYKVYIHQDVMLLNPYLIYELCEIFANSDVGLVGVAGVEKMPESGMWWDNDGHGDYRNLYQDSVLNRGHTLHNHFEELYRQVEVVDGAFMATQYDIPWRDDIFRGWHFYDISQCMEFGRQGYQVVVAGQPYGVWCLHEQKYNKRLGEAYQREKERYLHDYRNGY